MPQMANVVRPRKAEHTVPDIIANHDEGDVDDPVAVGQAIEAER